MAAAGVEFLVFLRRWLVNLRWVKRSVDHFQKRNHVGIAIADAADFEAILVHVDDLKAVFPGADFAERAQLRARETEIVNASHK